MRWRRILAVLGVCVMTWSQAQAMDAHEWWHAMNDALIQQTYHATVVHQSYSRMERLQIWHRLKDGQVEEHLWSPRGREIICANGKMQVIAPQSRSVTVHEFNASSLLNSVPKVPMNVDEHYLVELNSDSPVVFGRSSIELSIKPKDQYRFGLRFIIDVQSHLPLRSEVVDKEGHVQEQWIFTELQTAQAVAESGFNPMVDVTGFTEVHEATSPPAIATPMPFKSLGHLPPGFSVTDSRQDDHGRWRIVISDGLAMVSAFIEPDAGSPFLQKHSEGQIGTSRVVSDQWMGHKTTVVGDVPRVTVAEVAIALRENFELSAQAAVP